MKEMLRELETMLLACLAETRDGVSICFTGSVARGDYQQDKQGKTLTDVEVILVVPDRRFVDEARRRLLAYDWSHLAELGIKSQVCITLADALMEAASSGYARSLLRSRWPHDGLHLHSRLALARSKDPAAYALQPVAYYYAKYMLDHNHRSIVKVSCYLDEYAKHGRITDDFSVEERGDVDPKEVSRRCVEMLASAPSDTIGLLRSVSLLHAAIEEHDTSWETAFGQIRSEVFVENQGLTPSESIVRLE